MVEFDVDWVRRFRASWPNKNIAARKKLEALRAFFRFVHESGWIPTNPASRLKPPKITEPPTAPLLKGDVDSILKACDTYPDRANAIRLRALVLLLRYSGLRIRDAITLPRNRVQGDKLFLFTAKTGTPVYCPLPPVVMNALNAIPDSTYYFGPGFRNQKVQWGIGSAASSGSSSLVAFPTHTRTVSATHFPLSSCLRVCRSNAYRSYWDIRACGLQRSIMRHG